MKDVSQEPRISFILNGSERDLTVREALLADLFRYLKREGFEALSDDDIMPHLEKAFDACAEGHFPPSVVIEWLGAEFKLDRELGTFQARKAYLGRKLTRFVSHILGTRQTA